MDPTTHGQYIIFIDGLLTSFSLVFGFSRASKMLFDIVKHSNELERRCDNGQALSSSGFLIYRISSDQSFSKCSITHYYYYFWCTGTP